LGNRDIFLTGRDNPKERRLVFQRLLRDFGVDLALISDPKHIFYFTGVSTPRTRPFNYLVISANESVQSILITGESEEKTARGIFDETISTYRDYDLNSRIVPEQPFVAEQLRKKLTQIESQLRNGHGFGIESWQIGYKFVRSAIDRVFGQSTIDITPLILSMRRCKGTDELNYHKKATERLDRSYEAANNFAYEGNNELGLYASVNTAVFEKEAQNRFWEHTQVVGDFVSGERTLEIGGWPSTREFHNGDTIILDLQTMYKYHWADTARTFVIGKITEKQQKIFRALVKTKEEAESLLKPGIKVSEIFMRINRTLKQFDLHPLPHHAGHGIGLEGQEAPFFIPGSNEVLIEGDVCAIEPGVYDHEAGGMRIEDNYAITADGFEKLSRYPLNLH
jgi:Xaa-Pro dipeptidase